jgi:toxin-antitoxin system PIN domain toxin
VNVLVALAWPNHVHHEAAHRWFAGLGRRDGWATCPLTQSGFVRVSSNARIVPEARSPHEAVALLERIVERPGHRFWTDTVSIVSSPFIARTRLQGHRQVTDAHLLAVALANRGALATFDAGVTALAPDASSAAKAVRVIAG